jgi:hypothetical protein
LKFAAEGTIIPATEMIMPTEYRGQITEWNSAGYVNKAKEGKDLEAVWN